MIRVEGESGGVRLALEERLQWQGEELSLDSTGDVFRVSTFTGVSLADLTLEAIFGSVSQDFSPEPYNIIKLFDGDNFKDQTVLQLPFTGSASEGLGFPCSMGSVIKFIKKPSWQNDDKLREFLREMNFKGFVTLEYNNTSVQRVYLGVPNFGAFALMERWPGSLAGFDKLEDNLRFRESWAISTIVAAWPFPYNDGKTQPGVRINDVGDQVLKHFWPFAKGRVKNGSFTTLDCVIGIATAWDFNLSRMIDRLMWTCGNITVPMKMHRTDLLAAIRRKMSRIEEFLV